MLQLPPSIWFICWWLPAHLTSRLCSWWTDPHWCANSSRFPLVFPSGLSASLCRNYWSIKSFCLCLSNPVGRSSLWVVHLRSHSSWTITKCWPLQLSSDLRKNGPNCRKLKLDVWETVIVTCVVSAWLLSSFRPIVRRKPCLHPISPFPVMENSPDCHYFWSHTSVLRLT